jgi:GntR family transcriptional regulator/MocR family aminotransferase
MSNTWTTSEGTGTGPELLLALRGGGRRPLRARLEQALRDAVREGRLAPGDRLPSSRALAADLGVARGVVVEAYAQLVAEGWLDARRGSGTRVARPVWFPGRPAPHAPERDAGLRSGPASRGERAGGRPPGPGGGLDQPRFDFVPGRPDLSAFPRTAWLAALRRVLAELPASGLGYPDPGGAPALRAALAAYLGRVRGVIADPDLIVVTSGYGQALALLSRVLHDRGVRTIAFEDPLNPEPTMVAAHAGLRPVGVPVDGAGLDVDALAASRAGAAVVTSAHQFPTGVVLAPERRTALLAWAAMRGGVVLEDDYDAEYRYDREPVGAMQALGPDLVAYAGSVSKTLAPGLRLGWLVAPRVLAGELVEAKRLDDHGSNVLDQLTLAELLGSGAYDRHLRRTRRAYRARRDLLVGTLAVHAPGIRVRGVAAGLHVVVELPAGADERAVAAAARRRGVGVYPLGGYRTGSAATFPPALVVGYGGLAPADVRAGAERLAEVLAG